MSRYIAPIQDNETRPLVWFEFDQNNSGGAFDFDKEAGVGCMVFIQETTRDRAIAKALSLSACTSMGTGTVNVAGGDGANRGGRAPMNPASRSIVSGGAHRTPTERTARSTK